MLFTSCGTLSATSWTLAPRRPHTLCASLSGRQMGALVPLNRESPTTSTHCLFLWYLPCAAGVVSSCRPCSWVSIVVEASYLFLVVMLEGGAESCFCWSPGSKMPHLTGGLQRSRVLQPCTYLQLSSFYTA